MISTHSHQVKMLGEDSKKDFNLMRLIFFSATEVPSCHCSVFASSGRVQGSGSPQPPSHYPRKQGGHWHSWGNSGLHWFTIPRYSGLIHNDMKIFVADQRRIEERKEVRYVFSFYSPFSKNRILLTWMRMTCVLHFFKIENSLRWKVDISFASSLMFW